MSATKLVIPLNKNLKKKDFQSIETLISDLNALSIHVELSVSPSKSLLIFEYDSQAAKRNAGRKRKEIPSKSALQNMTSEEVDEWLLSHPIQTISEELEVGRATAFRRRAEARERFSYSITSLENHTDQ